jgi:hypothetical protein
MELFTLGNELYSRIAPIAEGMGGTVSRSLFLYLRPSRILSCRHPCPSFLACLRFRPARFNGAVWSVNNAARIFSRRTIFSSMLCTIAVRPTGLIIGGLTRCGEGYNLRSMPRVGQFCPSNIARFLLVVFIIVTLLIAIGFLLYHSPGPGTSIEHSPPPPTVMPSRLQARLYHGFNLCSPSAPVAPAQATFANVFYVVIP